jgi:hypothetical protein
MSLKSLIHKTTSIPTEALEGTPLPQFSVNERLRWREGRKTKNKEDLRVGNRRLHSNAHTCRLRAIYKRSISGCIGASWTTQRPPHTSIYDCTLRNEKHLLEATARRNARPTGIDFTIEQVKATLSELIEHPVPAARLISTC